MDSINCVNNTNFPSGYTTSENHRFGGIHFDEDNNNNNNRNNNMNNNFNNYNIINNNYNYNNINNSNYSNNININNNNNGNLRRQTSDSNSYTPHVFNRLANTNTANTSTASYSTTSSKIPLSSSVPSSSSAMKSMYQMSENSPVRPARLSGQELPGSFSIENKSHEIEVPNSFQFNHPNGPYWTSGTMALGLGQGMGQGTGQGGGGWGGQAGGQGHGTGQGGGGWGGQGTGQQGGGLRDNLMHNPRNPHPLSFQGAKSPLGHHKSFESTSSMRDLQYRENRDTSVGPSMFPNKKGDFLGKKVLTPRPLHGQSVNSLYSEHPTRDITLSSSSSESKHSASFSVVLFTNPTSLFHVFYFSHFCITFFALNCFYGHSHVCKVTRTHTRTDTYTHTHTHTNASSNNHAAPVSYRLPAYLTLS